MEDRPTISSSRLSAADVARATFSPSRRGFDPREVRSYLEQVARELATAEKRIADLRDRAAEAERRALHPALDEATLAAALGTQSAAILRSAHEEAQRVVTAAQTRASELLGEAQDRAAAIVVEAQSHAASTVADAEHTASSIDTEARGGAERLIDSAKANGEALVARAMEQGRQIVDQAQETRRKVLADLLVRRKTLHVQIEQLRAARDSLSGSVQALRSSVEATLDELDTSDERARQAAIELLRTQPSPPSVGEEALVQHASHPSGASAAEGEVPEDADAVEEIFAKLRKASLEDRGADARPRSVQHLAPDTATPIGAILQRRDDAYASARDSLVRKVKRALQDDQNAALERVRGIDGPLVASKIEDERAQRDRYALASVEALREAASAGRTFAGSESGIVGPELADHALADLAEDLAATLVTALRKKIGSDSSSNGTDRVTAAYREWRGARTERLCADMSLRAFHAGVAAAAVGQGVRFIVAPAEPPCEQCAKAGVDGSSGDAAESGSVRLPPLHAGCRCTVLPA